jgi:uncharacterized protein YciI
MNFVVIGKDKPDPNLRLAARADHLEFIAARQESVVYAGPLIDQGRMIGSVFIFDLPDRHSLDAHLAQDPYFVQGIFETVEIYDSRWMVPERTSGMLAAEIAKARAA